MTEITEPADLHHPELFTDLYELSMAQGYWRAGRADKTASFDYFFRSNPFEGGYVVFAGLGSLLERLDALRFGDAAIAYLATKGFDQDFLGFLSTWRFSGLIRSVREGEVVFPLEPVLCVEGTILEAQLLEAMLLNTLNFQSLVATKAARIHHAAQGRPFMEFGLRRAQSLGALHASRAAIIGGAAGTSNVHAAWRHDLNVSGTQAHSWIQHFDDELEAFRAWADIYPDSCVLLVDTYDTLESGVPCAIEVARELRERGKELRAVRLDSGDLAYLSKKTRAMLDEAGFPDVEIIVTNQLDEHLIKSLLDQGAPIDTFGVGTRLVTGHDASALDGVYKLSTSDGTPRLKISDNFTKVNFPGRKGLWRYLTDDGRFYGDGIFLAAEIDAQGPAPTTIHHPFFPDQQSDVSSLTAVDLLHDVMRDGERLIDIPTPTDSAAFARERLDRLPEEHKRFANPHTYKVGASKGLLDLRSSLYNDARTRASRREM